MHEFSLCEGIVATLEEEYAKLSLPNKAKSKVRVTRVRLVIGELHQVVPESLKLAFEMLTKETPMAGSVLELEIVYLAIRCRECGWEGEIKPPLFLCENCGKGDVEVTRGREMYIKDMEVEYDE
jgi:hydrogenase nickel incorporation protein HypA/HybF